MTSEQVRDLGVNAGPALVQPQICPIKLRRLQSMATMNGGVTGAATVILAEAACPMSCDGPTERQARLFGIALPFQPQVCPNPDQQQ